MIMLLTTCIQFTYSYSFDYKRDRYDTLYQRSGGGGGTASGGYHRDHRDRDRERRPDKRR